VNRRPQQDTIIMGNRGRRNYLDATGRELHVGDFITYVTRSGSSVYVNFGRIKELIDTDSPAYVGYGERLDPNEAAPRVESWDYAFKIKLIPYEYDRMRDRWHLPTRWDYDQATGKGEHVMPDNEDDVKVRTISAVERVIRLDLDV
jgi:hypothetical protein